MPAIRVRDLMTEPTFSIGAEASLYELRDLMDDKNIRHVPVTDGDDLLIGLVSHRDLLRSALAPATDMPLSTETDMMRRIKVADIMTRDVEVAEVEQDVSIAAQTMLDNKYGCMPVVEGGRLVGILTEADFVRYLAARSR
jgi:CBS domain-containing membrane protein